MALYIIGIFHLRCRKEHRDERGETRTAIYRMISVFPERLRARSRRLQDLHPKHLRPRRGGQDWLTELRRYSRNCIRRDGLGHQPVPCTIRGTTMPTYRVICHLSQNSIPQRSLFFYPWNDGTTNFSHFRRGSLHDMLKCSCSVMTFLNVVHIGSISCDEA